MNKLWASPQAFAAAATAAIIFPVEAQISTATVRGQVSMQGEAAGGAALVATNTATGYNVKTTSNADGSYVLTSLQPGSYRIVVTAPGMGPTTQLLTVQVGQNISLNFTLDVAQPASAALDTVVVIGTRDNRTSEVGTNITQKQIDTLPQISRNFLAFADLAPGVAFITGGDGSTKVQGGALSASNINVYIDGVGQKNYVLQGGISGQDSSRGNPFPQSAISEYKVITQNYKAEYDQISSAAITAVTKSGTNEFHGEVFADHSSEKWRAPTPAEQAAGKKTPSRDNQYGIAMGGPIVLDKMHWFIAYEGKTIDSPKTVTVGQTRSVTDLPADLQGLIGGVNEPFREDLFFGKVDWSINDSNLLELSVKVRREDETTNATGQTSLPASTLKKNDETRTDLHYQHTADTIVNDSHLTYEDASFNPRPRTIEPGYVLTTQDFGQVLLNAGGGRDYQNKSQRGWGLQDDVTFTGIEWKGSHVVKVGAKLKLVTVEAQEQNPYNPQFFYDYQQDTTIPFRVEFGAPLAGVGNGSSTSKNTQFGLYAQDDWEVNSNLTLNLGLRWDYERSPTYLDYVTPTDIVAGLRNFTGVNQPNSGVNINDYISTGSNRKTYTGQWQPRLGFSFDLNADQRHVIFGGLARAYDRNLFDYLQLENTKSTYPSYAYSFNTAGHDCPVGVNNCLTWDPSYYNPATLAALVAAQPGAGREIDLLNNNLKTPYSDQFSLGMRNRVADWNTEVTYSHIESKDGFTWLLGNRLPNGNFFVAPAIWGAPFGSPIPGYGALILGTNGLQTRSNSLFFKLERPYTKEQAWGVAVAYTYTKARENRKFDEHYSLDYPTLAGYGWKPSSGVSKHRLVATGVLDAPWGFVVSTRLTLATATPRYGLDCRGSTDDSQCVISQLDPGGGHFLLGGPMWGFRQLDFAASKEFKVPGGTLTLRGDLINVLNFRNYDGYGSDFGHKGALNANYGVPDGSLAGPTRTLKLGLAYAW